MKSGRRSREGEPLVLKIPYAEIVRDHAVSADGRGDRKLVVTERWARERATERSEWRAPDVGQACPVMEAPELEMAYFTEGARQDRHWHEQGTEIYTVLEGRMKIEVEGHMLELECRDSIVVRPPAVHYIPPGQPPFLCQVVVPFCGGAGDKFLAHT